MVSWVIAVSLVGCGTGPALRPIAPSPSRASETVHLDAAARGLAVEQLARRLETLYVKPTLGDSLARYIRGRFAARSYDGLSNPRAFANALSRDLDSVAHDLHLWVRYFPPGKPIVAHSG